MRVFFFTLSIMLVFFQCKKPELAANLVNSVETIITDMQLAHEGAPSGVPDSYDWAKKPRIGMGNNPGIFRALIPWGQLYEQVGGNPATNTRVQLRKLKIYIFSKKDKRWFRPISTEVIEGANYAEDFVDDKNRPADIQTPREGGGISVVAGGGYNFHFWTNRKTTIDPDDIDGVFSTCQARLVIQNTALPDDRLQAKYLLSIGADYWLDESAQWDNFKTNGDVAIGRFKYVTTTWQAFNMTTMRAEEIRKYPPPLE
ncbi:MAG: hypothetical protein MUE85_25010 [Microscillaceae bacterium]|jgi:hypothetical protein|nr:hypothetical protein [Microscillaceae bacterium]